MHSPAPVSPLNSAWWQRASRFLATRRTRWVLGIVSVLLVLYAVLGFLVLPRVLHGLIEREASEVLGRTLSLGELHINPFRFRVRLGDVRLAEPDGKGDMLSIAQAQAQLAPLESLFRRGVVLSSLSLDSPHVRISRLGPQRFSFSDILDRLNARPKPAKPAEPARFALNNITLKDGLIEFDDQPVSLQHRIDNIQIGLPFISTIASHVQVQVLPNISARVNGTVLALDGQVKPFADHREASLRLDLDPIDLTRYLPYLPEKLPFRVTQAFLSTQLQAVWDERPQAGAVFSLRGEAALSEVRIADLAGTEVLGWRRLQAQLRDVQPLAAPLRVNLGKVVLFEPKLNVRRLADGSLDLPYLRPTQQPAPDQPAALPVPAAQSTPQATKKPAPLIQLGEVLVQRGQVRWQDDAVAGKFSADLSALEVSLRGLDLSAKAKPAALSVSVEALPSGQLTAQGLLNAATGEVDLKLVLAALQLEHLRPYYAAAVGAAQPSGGVSAAAQLAWKPGEQGGLRLSQGSLDIGNFRLPEPGQKLPVARVTQLHFGGLMLDTAKRQFELGELRSRDANLRLVRDAEGINLLRLFAAEAPRSAVVVASSSSASMASSAASVATASSQAPWSIRTGKADITAWNASLEDRTGREPVLLALEQIAFRSDGLGSSGDGMGSVSLTADVNRKGKLGLTGRMALAPLRGQLKTELRAVDLLFAQPYVSSAARVLLTQAALDAQGDLGFALRDNAAAAVTWAGDLAINGLNMMDPANDADFLRWKRLAASKLAVSTVPRSLSIERLQIDDLYSRLILDAKGRLNVREITSQEEAADKAASNGAAGNKAVVTLPPSASAPQAGPVADPMKVQIGEILLSGGSINFSDRLIKPAFDMRLTDLSGSLRGLGSDPDAVATLSLKGALDQVAPVEISGQLSPLRRDRMLDIAARVTDIDLTGVSPYSGRYAGYGISKGKLSMNLQYKLEDKRLTASNQLRLDQLTFGDAVDSPDATSLPVQLAVALLKDRNGVIELDLPVSGTLDDPEFSVGSVLLRVLTNLITKAVSSPFSLLGSVFGGGEELSHVDFASGLSELSPATLSKVEALSRALNDRPALLLDVAGSADAQRDVPGLKRAVLQARLRALKAANAQKRGESTADVDTLTISAAEYPALLLQHYKESKLIKPRNALGLEKSLTQSEMEALLLADVTVGQTELLALATQRGQRVRDWLLTQGKVPAGRVFLVSARVQEEQGRDSATRVDFALK